MLLSGGVQQVRSRSASTWHCFSWPKGVSAPGAGMVPLTAQAIRKIGHLYGNGGLERALYYKQRPGAEALLEDSEKAADHCHGLQQSTGGFRPAGRCRLVAEEAVKTATGTARRARETIRILLPQPRHSKPWRKKMWCVAELNEDYIAKMEDVLQKVPRTAL